MMLNAKLEALRKENKQLINIHSKYKSEHSDLNQKIVQQKSEIVMLKSELEALKKQNKKLINVLSKRKSKNSDSLDQKAVQQKPEITIESTELKTLRKDEQLVDTDGKYKSQKEGSVQTDEVCMIIVSII